MDDGKRENNKVKRSKSEHVKNVVSVYLQRRQYPIIKPKKISKKLHLGQALLDSRIGRSNSILYSCYNSDPLVIEYNFTKFMYWLKDQTRYKHRCYDIEKLVGPLFCHLYLDILSGGHSDKAAAFFKAHVDKVDKSKCDKTVKDLITTFASDVDSTQIKEKFRSSKFVTELKPQSVSVLKKFVSESCHVVFLQTLQTWFDFGGPHKLQKENMVVDSNGRGTVAHSKDQKYSKLQSVIKSVKKLPLNIYNIKITNNKNTVTCGLIKRQAGLVAFAENNILKIMPIHVLESLFDVEKVHKQIKLNHHSKQIYCTELSPKNDILCTASADRSICIYDMQNLTLFRKVYGHLGPVYCVKISDNGKYLASGSADGTARLWSLKTGKTIRIFAGHTQAITCLQFHPNSLYLATGSGDKNVRVWCLKNANPVRLLHAAKGAVYAISYDPSGQLIACASGDKKIRIWDLSTTKVLLELRCRETPLIKVVWSKNGKQLCGGTVSGVVKVWDVSHMHSHHNKEHKYQDPIVTRKMNSRLLSLEFTMGTYGTLTV